MPYIRGEAREQVTMFPVTLDELVPGDHVCRVIEAFVGRLDMAKLGFVRGELAETGRPGYYPVHWWTYVIGYGPTLHAVSGPGGHGGLDSQLTLPFGPNQATFHIDSGYVYNPLGAFFHWLLNMTRAGGYPKC